MPTERTEAPGPVRRLPLGVKLAFGIGGLAESLKTVTFGLFLLFFYNSVRGVPGSLIGAVTAIGLVWDAVIDPSIGRASDRLHTPFGRRHLPMFLGALASGPLFFAVFSPPAALSDYELAAWLLLFGLLLRSSHSLFLIPYYALGAELSSDYQERSALSAARTAFVFAGTLIVVIPSFPLFFAGTVSGEAAMFDGSRYGLMGGALGLLMTSAGLAAVFGTAGERERLRPSAVQQTQRSLLPDLWDAIQQRSYRCLVVSASLFFMGSVANASLAISYLTYYARIQGGWDIGVFQAGFHIGALLGVPFWLRLAHRIDKHRLYAAACVAVSAVAIGAYVCVGEGRWVEPGDLPPMVAGHALSGFAAAALWILPASMLADATDADEIHTGKRREATLFGLYSLGHQIAAGFAVIVTGVLLDVFAQIEPGVSQQAAPVTERIGLLFGAVPASIFLVAMWSISGYDLTRERIAEIQSELARRKSACRDV